MSIIRFILHCMPGDTYTHLYFCYRIEQSAYSIIHSVKTHCAHIPHKNTHKHSHTHICSANATLILFYFGYSQLIWFFAVIHSGKLLLLLLLFGIFSIVNHIPSPLPLTYNTSQDLSHFIYFLNTKKIYHAMAHTIKFSSVTMWMIMKCILFFDDGSVRATQVM